MQFFIYLLLLSACFELEPKSEHPQERQNNQKQKTAPVKKGKSSKGAYMNGQAYNLAIAAGDSFTVDITKIPNGAFVAKGGFAGQRLLGSFEASGRSLKNCTQGHTCLFFMGLLDVSDPETGWSTGTKTSFSMTLDVLAETKKVLGVYEIGPLETFDYIQHGQLNLELAVSPEEWDTLISR